MFTKFHSSMPKKLILWQSALLILMFPISAQAAFETYVPNAGIVGEGRLKVFFMDIYDLKLHAPNGQWRNDRPFALEIDYLRPIEGYKITEYSVEKIEELGFDDPDRLKQWEAKMNALFPDVEKGTNLTGIVDAQGASVFYKDGIKIGEIADPEFGLYFFGIWLDENTSSPSLRRKILGLSHEQQTATQSSLNDPSFNE